MVLTANEAREVMEALAEIVQEHGGTSSYGIELAILGMEYEDERMIVFYGFDPTRKRGPLYQDGIVSKANDFTDTDEGIDRDFTNVPVDDNEDDGR